MRISDWSSDVCSSDLRVNAAQLVPGRIAEIDVVLIGECVGRATRRTADNSAGRRGAGINADSCAAQRAAAGRLAAGHHRQQRNSASARLEQSASHCRFLFGLARITVSRQVTGQVTDEVVRLFQVGSVATRSEEHTSELQSLMRTSYAVFCLKKKNINNTMQP